jgi:hypothetical protein
MAVRPSSDNILLASGSEDTYINFTESKGPWFVKADVQFAIVNYSVCIGRNNSIRGFKQLPFLQTGM